MDHMTRRFGIPKAIQATGKMLFCNGPPGVNPLELILPPVSLFCPGSALGRHLMVSE